MNMNIQTFRLIAALQFFIIGCSQQAENIDDILLIIPQNGCPSCVELGKKIAIETVNLPCAEIVFTNLNSQKELKIEMGYDFFEKTNVALDLDGKFSEYVTSFPKLYKNGEIINIDTRFYMKSSYDSLILSLNCIQTD